MADNTVAFVVFEWYVECERTKSICVCKTFDDASKIRQELTYREGGHYEIMEIDSFDSFDEWLDTIL